MCNYGEGWEETVFSDGSKLFLSESNPEIGDEVEIKIRLSKYSPIKRVYISYINDGERYIIMMSGVTKDLYDIYNISIEVSQPEITYHFILSTDTRNYFYNQSGLTQSILDEDYDFKIISNFKNPAWTEDTAFYQLFNGTFYNVCRENDVKANRIQKCGYVGEKIQCDKGRYKYIKWKVEDLSMGRKNAEILKRRLMACYGRLPFQMQRMQFNCFDSKELCRLNDSPDVQNESKLDRESVKSLIIMMYTFMGIPCIYYSDEIMRDINDGTDQICRNCINGGSGYHDKEISDLLKKMIKLRMSESVIKYGSFRFLESSDNILSYARFDDKAAVVFINSQENENKKLSLRLDSVGQANKIEYILGSKNSCTLNKNTLELYINSKESSLIKVYLK